jgi:hypothetical protein
MNILAFNKQKFLLTLLLFLIIGIACKTTMKPTQYRYSDSSANTWKISSDSVEYIPMTPEMSSSGMYSGGDPVKKQISKADYNKVKSEINNILMNMSIQIKDRTKLSGLIIIMEDGKKDVSLLIDISPEKENLEKMLKKLIE